MVSPVKKFYAEARLSGIDIHEDIKRSIHFGYIGNTITHLGLDNRTTPMIEKLSEFTSLKELKVLRMGEYHEFSSLIPSITNFEKLTELYLKFSPYEPGPIGAICHRSPDFELDLSNLIGLEKLGMQYIFKEELDCGLDYLHNLKNLTLGIYSMEEINLDTSNIISNLVNLEDITINVNGNIILTNELGKLSNLKNFSLYCDQVQYEDRTRSIINDKINSGLIFSSKPYQFYQH